MVSRLICGGLIGLAVLAGSVSAQTVLYVDCDATDPPDGSSWCTAYRTLDEALAVAAADTVIRVADGTYTPDPSGLADPREATFQLLNGVTVEGGYAGCGAADPDARDMAAYPTVLSGDIGTPDDNADNCYHVVTGSGTDASAVLDGVTITGGNADGASPHNNGGGMLNNPGSPTVNRCTFGLNSAINAGGGTQNYSSSPTLTNCAFNGNVAEHGGGVNNGAGSSSTLVNCMFSGNAAGNSGGGVRNWESSSTLINCSLAGNVAEDDGGGLYNYGSNTTLTNCILWANTAPTGGQIRFSWNASPSVTYSCIEGGWEGEGNIDADPAFARNPNAGVDGEWGTADDDYGDLHLRCISPCLDAGTNTTDPPLPAADADGNPRIVNDVVDMGAYEGAGANVFVVTPQNVVVPEGASAEFTVALACDPNGPVSVDVSFESGDADIAIATAMPLSFDSSDYWVAQPVTLTAAEDPDQLNGSAVFAVTARGVAPSEVVASEGDNDTPPSVLYVDASATGACNGTSWADAYPELSDALVVAAAFPVVEQIQVADGTYTPDPSGQADPREATFQLVSSVTVEGGYAGYGAPDPDARDIATYQTVLSGDIGTPGDRADNCYHVVIGSGTDATAVLDGVTISGGNGAGGGMFNNSGSPTLIDCTFTGNNGGGMRNYNSSPTLTNCKFARNSAYSYQRYDGGGMENSNSSPTLTNCTFSGNVARDGAGMQNRFSCSPTLINCTFIGNVAARYGGGIENIDDTNLKLVNCTFAKNVAEIIGGAVGNWNATVSTMTNCILWGNTAPTYEQIRDDLNTLTVVTYSCVEGHWPGDHNIGADPRFVRPPHPGPDAQWGTSDDDYGDLRLACDSPCIDAGTNTTDPPLPATDADGNPRIVNGVVDMGPYEGAHNVLVITPHSMVVAEGGSAEFTVALACDPGGPISVDVSLESGDPDIAVATPMPLAFDSYDYSIPQPVSLTAAEDADQAPGSAMVAVTANGFVTDRVAAREAENDVPSVLYVDASATGDGDGTSWTDAYPDLHDAFFAATYAPLTVEEIRVADGSYIPDTWGLTDPREATFQLLNGVSVKGGYAGFGAPDPDARDVAVHQTRLDGNIGSPWTSADNCYHVVTASGTDATAILDGVTIAAGNANGASPHDKGAGMLNEGGSPTLTRCTFTHNTAAYAGGGMCNCAGLPALSNCTFDQNTCDHVGGGMNNSTGSDVTLVNCTFRGNGATDNGGAMHNWESSPTLVNCTLGGNWVTIWPDYVGGIFNHASSPTLANCILWANSGTQMNGSATVTWSCIQDGWEGATNTHYGPAFVRNPSRGSDQEWGTFDDDYGDLHLAAGSLCINRGDPYLDYTGQTDMDGEPRVLDGRVDAGADEYSALAAPWLVASDPPDGGTLPKTQANVIRLTFSWAIALPTGPALQIEPVGGGADVGDQFGYSLETTSAADDSLKSVEVGSVLANLTWYHVTPAAGFDVEPFTLDLCVLVGDANGSGRITTADYAEIKEHMGEYTDARYDLNGSGRVTTADYSVVKAHMAERVPTKP